MSPRSSLACIGGGYALAFAINLAVASMEPTGVYVTHAVLPLLSAVAFHTVKTDPAGSVIVKGNARVMLASFPFALLAGMGLFGFVMRLLFDFSEMRVAVPDEIATVYAGIVVPAIVMIAAIFYSREIDYTKFCRLIMPATVLIALAIAMSEAGHQSYEAFAIGCVWVFYKIFCWAVARAVAYKTEMHPITVFAIANILLNLFTYIPLFLVGLFPIEADSMVMVATIVACALLIAVFLLRDDKLENVFSREKKSFEGIIRVNREGTVEDCVNLASAEFGLTEREREIACKVLQGETNESIIGELFISKNTLRTHMHNIDDKTDTPSREELVNLLLSYQ